MGRSAWWSSVLATGVLLLGTQLSPWFRRNQVIAATVVVLLTVAVWAPLLPIVSGNLFAE